MSTYHRPGLGGLWSKLTDFNFDIFFGNKITYFIPSYGCKKKFCNSFRSQNFEEKNKVYSGEVQIESEWFDWSTFDNMIVKKLSYTFFLDTVNTRTSFFVLFAFSSIFPSVNPFPFYQIIFFSVFILFLCKHINL